MKPPPQAIYTFAFERASAVDEHLLSKLRAAVRRRAVVLSPPAALKSFALRFVELMHTLDYASRDDAYASRSRGFFGQVHVTVMCA